MTIVRLYMLSFVCLFATPWTVAHQVPLSMEFPGKNTGVGCYFLLQCILPTQGLNLLLLHGQVGSLPLSHQVVVVVVYSLSRVGLLQPCGPQHSRLLCPWDFQVRILEWVAISSSRGSS